MFIFNYNLNKEKKKKIDITHIGKVYRNVNREGKDFENKKAFGNFKKKMNLWFF